MPSKTHRRPETRRLALCDLVSRHDRSNVLTGRVRQALAQHIRERGCYPPLIVRALPARPGKYEILDGRHRAEVLRALGETTARCEVWPVADDDAELLAVTLNRLHGRDDTRRRARQVGRLVRRLGRAQAARALGVTPRALEQQLAPSRPPRQQDAAGALDLQAVVFHLSSRQAELLRRTLGATGRGRLGRGEALMRALRRQPAARPTRPDEHAETSRIPRPADLPDAP